MYSPSQNSQVGNVLASGCAPSCRKCVVSSFPPYLLKAKPAAKCTAVATIEPLVKNQGAHVKINPGAQSNLRTVSLRRKSSRLYYSDWFLDAPSGENKQAEYLGTGLFLTGSAESCANQMGFRSVHGRTLCQSIFPLRKPAKKAILRGSQAYCGGRRVRKPPISTASTAAGWKMGWWTAACPRKKGPVSSLDPTVGAGSDTGAGALEGPPW